MLSGSGWRRLKSVGIHTGYSLAINLFYPVGNGERGKDSVKERFPILPLDLGVSVNSSLWVVSTSVKTGEVVFAGPT